MELHTTEPQSQAAAPHRATVDPPRPLRPLASTVMIALGLVTLANVSALWVDVIQLGLATDLESGQRVPFDELSASDDRVATAGLFQGACYLLSIVAFLTWYGRAYRNLSRLGVEGLRWGNRWAIAYWFIPIANLFRPKQVVNDIWRASDSDVPQGASWGGRVPAVIHWWWALWLISSFAERILFRRSMETVDSPAEFVSLSQTYVVWDLIEVIPAALAFLVVRKISIRQEEHRRRFERGELLADTPAPPEPDLLPKRARRAIRPTGVAPAGTWIAALWRMARPGLEPGTPRSSDAATGYVLRVKHLQIIRIDADTARGLVSRSCVVGGTSRPRTGFVAFQRGIVVSPVRVAVGWQDLHPWRWRRRSGSPACA